MASDATARHRMRPAIITLVVLLSFTGPARADETPLIVAGALFESPTLTLAPLVVLRVPVGPDVIAVSQIGWTSGVVFDAPREGALRWESTAAMTPVRAHLAHGVFASNGDELAALEFDDTALRVTTGAVWDRPHVHLLLHAVGGKEWLSRLAAPLAAAFDAPFGGGEAIVTLDEVRGEDPLASRIDGLRVTVRGEGLAGTQAWADASVALSAGRQVGPLFARADAGAFYVTFDHPVTNFLIGGSWDILGPVALYGHPLGAFRLSEGAAGTAGLDMRVIGPIEIGARASALVGTPVVHEGLAALVRGDVRGIDFFAGAGTADGALFRGDLTRTSIFAGASAAMFFLP
jgi:hypothetical protein